jgi:membrane protein DedA with SNARE-associated domain
MNGFIRKSLMNGIVVVPLLLWFTEATFLGSVITALTLSTLAYFLGDQLVLRMSNNLIATAADAILAFTFLWAVAYYSRWTLTFGELLIIVALLGVVEWIFHKQLRRMGT